MNKRVFAFTIGLFIFLALLTYGIITQQFIETENNGSLLCLYCLGIG